MVLVWVSHEGTVRALPSDRLSSSPQRAPSLQVKTLPSPLPAPRALQSLEVRIPPSSLTDLAEVLNSLEAL